MQTLLIRKPTHVPLLNALYKAGLCSLEPAVLLTTEDEHVAALIAKLGGETFYTGGGDTTVDVLLITPVEVVAAPVASPVVDEGNETQEGQDAGPDVPEKEEITYTDVATGQVHTVGAIRQMLRFKRVGIGQQFDHPKKGRLIAEEGADGKIQLVRMGVAKEVSRPEADGAEEVMAEKIPAVESPVLEDLRAIVRDAGQKALHHGRENGQKKSKNLAVVEGPTIYTNPLTQEEISYGAMRELLANRRVNPKERFFSNRHGWMEVRDFGRKLKLVRVEREGV